MAEKSSLVRLQKEFDIVLDWRGFELHPETPPGGILLRDMFPGGRYETMREYLKNFAAKFGITDMGEPEKIPNTRRALAAAEYAREKGKQDSFRNMAMDAHWKYRKDLEDGIVIREIARQAGLDPEAVVKASDDPRYLDRIDAIRNEAEDMMVTGIPTFFFGEHMVVGCQQFEFLARAAKKAGAHQRRNVS